MRLFLVNLGYVLLALNFILYALRFFKHGRSFKVFTVYLLLIIGVQLTSYLYMKLYNNNLFLSHFYFIGQFIVLSLFYFTLVKDNFQKKAISIAFVLVLLTLIIQYGIKPDLFFKFNLYGGIRLTDYFSKGRIKGIKHRRSAAGISYNIE